QIKIVDLNHSELAFPRRLFAQRQSRGLFRRHLPNRYWAIVPDDLIGKIDGLLNSFVGRIVKRDIDLAFVLKHAKAVRRRVEQLNERRRENVLTRVLLQMIEPSQPINLAVDAIANLGHGSLDHVQHAIAFGIDAIDYSSVAKRPGVSRLPAAGRIKRRAIKGDRNLAAIALADADDDSVELKQARFLVVESLSYIHRAILVSLSVKFKASTDFCSAL